MANLCPGQLCLNTEGSYTCRSCEAGFQVNEGGRYCEGKRASVLKKSLIFQYAAKLSQSYSGPQYKRNALGPEHDYRKSLQRLVIFHDMIYGINAGKWLL